MPTPNATLLASVNGGAPTTGGITAAAGDTVQFSFQNTTGWGSGCKLELSFPSGFSLPAGWSSETVDGHTVYYVLGRTTPPPITLGPWGKYMPRLIVNGGAATDEDTAISVPSPGGLLDLGHREAGQFGGSAEKWTKDQQANLRVIESGLGGVGTADVDPTADTLVLRGSAGEAKASSLALTPGTTKPTAAGQIYIDADGRVWAWSPYSHSASTLIVELDFPQYSNSRFDGGATSMAERPLTPVLDIPNGERSVVVGHIIPEAALTADATNYATIRIYRRTGSTGGSQTLLAEVSSTLVGVGATGNWTAFKRVDVFIDSLALPDGTYLTWEIVPAGGAPPTVPACTMYVGITRSGAFPS